jgi:hypothetical protein
MWFFGVQTIYVYETRRMAKNNPILWITPVELSDLSISKAESKKLSYLGYDFEVPWSDVDEEKTRVIGNKVATIVFRSGNVISIWSKPQNGLVSLVVNEGEIDRNKLAQMFGVEAAKSDYDFERAALGVIPDDISIFISRKQAVQRGTLVMMKSMFLPTGSETGVYSIRTREFKGFQYGRPRNSMNGLSVELFGTDAHLQIVFGQKLNGAVAISQADVNRVVQTLHKVQTKDLGSETSPLK